MYAQKTQNLHEKKRYNKKSITESFFNKEAAADGVGLPETYAVAMVFSNNETDFDVINKVCENNDLKVLYTRTVPVDTNALGEQALA